MRDRKLSNLRFLSSRKRWDRASLFQSFSGVWKRAY